MARSGCSVVVQVGAVIYVRRAAGQGDGKREISFENPMYAAAPSDGPAEAQAPPSTGYMDVSPGYDDENEHV